MSNAKNEKTLNELEVMVMETIQHWTKARDGVQNCLVGILSAVHQTKSQEHVPKLVNMILDGIGDGINGNDIRAWCGMHLNMVLNKEKKMSCKKFNIEKYSSTKTASLTLWYKLKVQNPTLFDLDAQIVALLARAEKMAEATPDEGDVIHVSAEALVALKAIADDAARRVVMFKAEQKAKQAA